MADNDNMIRPTDDEIISFVTESNPTVDPIVHIYSCISSPIPDDMKAASTDLLQYYITHILPDHEASTAFESFLTKKNNTNVIVSEQPYDDIKSSAENSPKQQQQAQVQGRANVNNNNNASDDSDDDQDPISAQIKLAKAKIATSLSEINKRIKENEQLSTGAMLFRRKFEVPTLEQLIEKNRKIQQIHELASNIASNAATNNINPKYLAKIKALGKVLI